MLVTLATAFSLALLSTAEGNSILSSVTLVMSASEVQPTTTSLSLNVFCSEFKSATHLRQGMLQDAQKSISTNFPSMLGLSPNHRSASRSGAGRPNKDPSDTGSAILSSEVTGCLLTFSVPLSPREKNVVASSFW